MNKKQRILLLSTLLLTACGGTTTSLVATTSNPSSVTSTAQVSSTVPVIPTAALTDDMLAGIKLGYSATSYSKTDYSGGSPSCRILELDTNIDHCRTQIYTHDPADYKVKDKRIYDWHYCYNPEEETKMLYEAGLSVGNEVIYNPVLTRNPLTLKEVPTTWAKGYYDNAFAEISAANFERVGSENKFALNLNDSTLKTKKVYEKLGKQLFGDTVDAPIEHFYLLTNGDQIVGFDLLYKTVSSYDTMVQRSATGEFDAFGADVVSAITPLTGETDPVFEAAVAKLQAHNYEARQTQKAYDFDIKKFADQGTYVYQVEDAQSINYDYYTAQGKKYMNYAYKTTVGEDQSGAIIPCKQGYTQINGEFYSDYLYAGTVDELMPDMKLSSLLFKKDASSTADKAIYKLDKDIRISLENNSSMITPFNARGRDDRLIYTTLTIENDKITFKNETSDYTSAGGLIMEIEFTKFGQIKDLIPESKIHETCDSLTWSELLSNSEGTVDKLEEVFGLDIINEIPTFGGYYSTAMCDVSSPARPIFFVATYDKDETYGLYGAYGSKLINSGFTFMNESKVDVDASEPVYPLYQKAIEIDGDTYNLNITLVHYWNSNGWGQFQAHVFVS